MAIVHATGMHTPKETTSPCLTRGARGFPEPTMALELPGQLEGFIVRWGQDTRVADGWKTH